MHVSNCPREKEREREEKIKSLQYEQLSPLLRNNSHPLVLKSSTPFTGEQRQTCLSPFVFPPHFSSLFFCPVPHVHTHIRWWPPRELAGEMQIANCSRTARFQCPRSRCYSCPWITLERLARILLEFAYRPWNWKSFPQTRVRSYTLDVPVIRLAEINQRLVDFRNAICISIV